MNKRHHRLKNTQPYLPYADFISKVNGNDFHMLSEKELKEAVNRFRFRVSLKQSEQAVLFALIKEIICRLTGMRLFDSQLAASVSLMNGKIAELPTGEGKTLAAVIPALIHALQGLRVHVLTFNDYLAERDFTITRRIYEFCGTAAGFVTQEMSKPERAAMYQRDIVYVTAKEAGFDYLKNFLCSDERELIPFAFDYCIVDEADSILIDEARNPLVIACDQPRNDEMIIKVRGIFDRLEPDDYVIRKDENQAYLTEQGVRKVEKILALENLYEEQNIDLLSMVNMALQARFLLKRDLDYIIKDHQIHIIDASTGRISKNKKYPDLLHASLEAKEGLSLSGSSMIYNMITIQNYLLRYRKLCGMTGTAIASKNEFYQVYGLEVDIIPPHIPSRRIDHEPLVFLTKAEKFQAVADAVASSYTKGQPVLLGTQSVEESELLSGMLRDREIPHHILNAKNDKEEAVLIAEAGKPSAVTVSTNMAGRGVDIKLGGGNETERNAVQAAGGLYVIGAGLNRSSRIDLQLCGRAGRQGDTGESRFFVSFDDELFDEQKHLPLAELKEALKKSRTQAGKAVRRVQHHTEGTDEAARLVLSRYSYILEQQRQIITDYRDQILGSMAGERGFRLAEKQLTLYYINLHWAYYLESMEYIRDGIHLTVIGGLDPLDEYHKMAVSAFDEAMRDVEADVRLGLETYEITENGIDMDAAGLGSATTTWTYLIDESKSQFTSLPHIISGISNYIKGNLYSLKSIANGVRNLVKNLKTLLFKRSF